MYIHYNNKIVAGQFFTRLETREQPTVSFVKDPHKMYTVLVVDADTPNPDHVHWMIVNITLIDEDVIFPYQPPEPIYGFHRYLCYLFDQKQPIYPLATQRSGFSIRDFMNTFQVTNIISFYFLVRS